MERITLDKCKSEDEVVDLLNEELFVVLHKGKTLYGREQSIKGSNQKEVAFATSSKGFIDWYANRLYKNVNAYKIWLSSAKRREYKRPVFDPTYTGNGVGTKDKPLDYNLYQGFAVKPSKAGTCDLWKKHLLEIICDNREDLYEYVMDWLADMIQNPGGHKNGVALVLKGEKGCGKGTFCKPFLKIWGTHALHLQGQEQLLSRFNYALANKIFVFGDEALLVGNKKVEGKLKGLITEDTTILEQKYMDAIEVENHMRFVFASNEESVIPATPDERRFCVLPVSSKKARDAAYFQKIHEELDNGGTEALLYELLYERKIKSVLQCVPRTEGLWDEVVSSFSTEEAFFYYELLKENNPYIKENEKNAVMKSYLYEHVYRDDFCKNMHSVPIYKNKFSALVKKYFPQL